MSYDGGYKCKNTNRYIRAETKTRGDRVCSDAGDDGAGGDISGGAGGGRRGGKYCH
jgi:hypothetical protein